MPDYCLDINIDLQKISSQQTIKIWELYNKCKKLYKLLFTEHYIFEKIN
jgi:hypothetical protein